MRSIVRAFDDKVVNDRSEAVGEHHHDDPKCLVLNGMARRVYDHEKPEDEQPEAYYADDEHDNDRATEQAGGLGAKLIAWHLFSVDLAQCLGVHRGTLREKEDWDE